MFPGASAVLCAQEIWTGQSIPGVSVTSNKPFWIYIRGEGGRWSGEESSQCYGQYGFTLMLYSRGGWSRPTVEHDVGGLVSIWGRGYCKVERGHFDQPCN